MGNNAGTISGGFEQLGEITKTSVGLYGNLAVGGLGLLSGKSVDKAFHPWTENVKYGWDIAKGDNQQFTDLAYPPTSEQLTQRRIAQQTKTRNTFNTDAQSKALAVGHVSNSAYSGNMSSVTPPSQLQKISDPATRMARAGATGNRLHAINTIGKMQDLQAHSTIAQATGASSDVNPPNTNQNTGTASQTPNGAETLQP